MSVATTPPARKSGPGRLLPAALSLAAGALCLLSLAFGQAAPVAAGKLVFVDILPAVGATLAQYQPATLQVQPGDTVVWTNRDGEDPHNVIIEKLDKYGIELLRGESDLVTFDKPGVYDYTCGPHPYMKGQVIVLAPPTPVAQVFLPLSIKTAFPGW